MTSKEALEHIVNNDYNTIITTYPSQEAYNGLTKREMVEIIEKDLDKLSQLEEIEKELGIDLITLFKALKSGMYKKIKPNKKNRNPEPRFWSYEELSLGYQWYSNEYEAIQNDTTIYEGHNFGLIVDGELFNLEDYGKTWALTKEELENETH